MLAMLHLLHDPVDLAVLGVDLLSHVQGHVTQVANDPAHLLKILIHLVLPGIVCYPGTRSKKRKDLSGITFHVMQNVIRNKFASQIKCWSVSCFNAKC